MRVYGSKKDIFLQTNTRPLFAANLTDKGLIHCSEHGVGIFAKLRGGLDKGYPCCNAYTFKSELELPWDNSVSHIKVAFYLNCLVRDQNKSYDLIKIIPVKVIKPEEVDKTIRIKLD